MKVFVLFSSGGHYGTHRLLGIYETKDKAEMALEKCLFVGDYFIEKWDVE